MSRKPITPQERDAIVADVKALAEKHRVSGMTIARLLMAERKQELRA